MDCSAGIRTPLRLHQPATSVTPDRSTPWSGSTFRPGGPGTEPANYMEVRPVDAGGNAGTRLGRTSDFIVSGKIAGPIVSDTTSSAFGPQALGTSSASHTVTLTNLFPTAISGFTPTLGGTNPGFFTITGGTCTALTSLARDASCTVTVAFTPPLAGPTGAKAATLNIVHNGLRSPVSVSLTGTAVDPGQPAVQVTPTTLAFGNQNVGTTSAGRIITVSNTGNAALEQHRDQQTRHQCGRFQESRPTARRASGSEHRRRRAPSRSPSPPRRPATRAATVRIQSNDPVRPTVNVSLTGTGVGRGDGGVADVADFKTKGTTNNTLNITNTGTAVLNLVGNPALVIVGSGLPTSNTTKFTASNVNCNNVAAGGKCSIRVTFTPGAGANNQTFTARLQINSNATNSPFFVSLSGQRA